VSRVRWGDAAFAWAACLACLGWGAAFRRPVLFWAFDEPVARSLGVHAGRTQTALLILLAVTVVASMKLVGVVLASALLVLPGATALRVSDRLGPVFALSALAAAVGVTAGLLVALALGLPAGACMVLVMAVTFACTWPAEWIETRARTRRAGAEPPALPAGGRTEA
jgi:ABC-type Mn2+/Zn2+ transport system permease subunit